MEQHRLASLAHAKPRSFVTGAGDEAVSLNVFDDSLATFVGGEDGVLHVEGTSRCFDPGIPSRLDRKTLALGGGHRPREPRFNRSHQTEHPFAAPSTSPTGPASLLLPRESDVNVRVLTRSVTSLSTQHNIAWSA